MTTQKRLATARAACDAAYAAYKTANAAYEAAYAAWNADYAKAYVEMQLKNRIYCKLAAKYCKLRWLTDTPWA